MGNEWEVERVDYSEYNFMIHVYLRYTRDTVLVGGKELKIWDYRPEREWRHLDMWQCQTFIHAKIPRYFQHFRTTIMFFHGGLNSVNSY